MIDFFCKNMAAINFCDDRKFAFLLHQHVMYGRVGQVGAALTVEQATYLLWAAQQQLTMRIVTHNRRTIGSIMHNGGTTFPA